VILRISRGVNPQPPSALNSKVPRDLEAICLKCLEKEPGQRFATAHALADHLRCYLEDTPFPLPALPKKFFYRHPLWFLLGAVALVTVLFGSLNTLYNLHYF